MGQPPRGRELHWLGRPCTHHLLSGPSTPLLRELFERKQELPEWNRIQSQPPQLAGFGKFGGSGIYVADTLTLSCQQFLTGTLMIRCNLVITPKTGDAESYIDLNPLMADNDATLSRVIVP